VLNKHLPLRSHTKCMVYSKEVLHQQGGSMHWFHVNLITCCITSTKGKYAKEWHILAH